MFQHILVPLDGSSRSEQVLPVAARLARATGGTITLLRIVEMAPEAAFYTMEGPFLPQRLLKRDLVAAQQYLHQVSQRSDLARITPDTVVDLGDPALKILSHAEGGPIDLIILSSHGYSGIKRWLLGSVAEKVARHAPVPVLVLQTGASLRTHLDADGARTIRAFVPVDLSARSMDAIPPAAALVAALSSPGHGQIHLAHLVVAPTNASPMEQEELLRAVERNLAGIGRDIRDGLVTNVDPDLGVTFSWTALCACDIAEGIVRVAEHGEAGKDNGKETHSDLIALTTHGSTGIHRWAVGSIAERVLHASHLPLLLVRPADMLVPERTLHERQGEMIY